MTEAAVVPVPADYAMVTPATIAVEPIIIVTTLKHHKKLGLIVISVKYNKLFIKFINVINKEYSVFVLVASLALLV